MGRPLRKLLVPTDSEGKELPVHEIPSHFTCPHIMSARITFPSCFYSHEKERSQRNQSEGLYGLA